VSAAGIRLDRRAGRRRRVGLYAAKKVQMTQMPELVALMHSLVGLAACLVGFASYVDTSLQFVGAEKAIHEVEIYRHPDRRDHLLGLDRLRQAVGQDRRQAAAAAGTALAEPRRAAGGDLVRPRVPACAKPSRTACRSS
jgi:hypothetical protein